MAIKINWQDLQKRIINWKEVEKVMLNWTQIRPDVPPTPVDNYLAFTGASWAITVTLSWLNGLSIPSLEVSYDKTNWEDWWGGEKSVSYGTRLYVRNKASYYNWRTDRGSWKTFRFSFWGESGVLCKWDIGYLTCKDSTNVIYSDAFRELFRETNIVTCPSLPATTIYGACYARMFYRCVNLETLPRLPALTIEQDCYNAMFRYCSKIKLSTTQTWEYQTPYRIPTEGIGNVGVMSTRNMFSDTWWTYAPWRDTPINQTFYTSNTVV